MLAIQSYDKEHKILLASSDTNTISFFNELLDEQAIHLINVVRGRELIKRLVQTNFSLIFLDTTLEDMDGEALIPIVKELSTDVSIVFMTPENTIEQERKAREQGILYYLVKPYSEEEIREIVQTTKQKSSILF